MLGAAGIFSFVTGIGDEAVEPVGAVILALVGDMKHHAGMVEAGAFVEFVVAGRIHLGRDQAVGNLYVRKSLQRRGGQGAGQRRLRLRLAADTSQECGSQESCGTHLSPRRGQSNRRYRSSAWSGPA